MTRIAIGLIVALVVLGCTPPAPEQEISALQLYVNNCAACHGEQGEGDGPVAAVLGVRVPNLRELSSRSGGEYPADAVRAYIDGRSSTPAHGARYMPVWGDEFTYMEASGSDREVAESSAQQRIGMLVDFVAELQY